MGELIGILSCGLLSLSLLAAEQQGHIIAVQLPVCDACSCPSLERFGLGLAVAFKDFLHFGPLAVQQMTFSRQRQLKVFP
jgi:hypothetical protein